MNRSVDIQAVSRDLSRLLDEIDAVARFIVTRNGRPVALLAPAEVPIGFANFDPTESFFEPLPEEEMRGLGKLTNFR